MPRPRRTHANPDIWGRGTWILLHCMTATYPLRVTQRIRDRYGAFLHILAQTLPCRLCRLHSRRFITRHPPRLEDRSAFMHWMIDFHNYVNRRLGKPVLSYDVALRLIHDACR